jgi:aspartate ammonia-lyase
MDGSMRIEKDSLGEANIPDDALYGLESIRARENFDLGGPSNPHLILAMVKIKKAAARSFVKLFPGEAEKFNAIEAACDTVIEKIAKIDRHDPADKNNANKVFLEENFITGALQGGAGTSLNMNVNEVLANLALSIMGKRPGDYVAIHPLDDVNRFQSTNDVFPTALRIAAIDLLRELSQECAKLQEALQKKETEYENIHKLGRTELMDAVPISLGSEFGAYAQAIARDRWRLYKVEERLRQVNLGGAAVGFPDVGKEMRQFRYTVIEELRSITGMGLASAEYPMDLTQNNDVFVEVSGLLKAHAVNLSKIAGDFRLMNSGPRGGFGEIKLAALQKGSTIMAGKVNPVIPEMAIQVSIKVCANDSAVTMAASRGEFELNAFFPLIADSVLESLELLKRCTYLFRTKCVETLEACPERCAEILGSSWAFAASYVPLLGYDKVSAIIAAQGEKQNAAEMIRRELENAKAALSENT